MITAEIKIHKEPPTYQHTQGYTSYTLMNGTQKEQYEAAHKVYLEEAKKAVKVGQIVKLDANVNKVIITGFIEEPKEVIQYCGNMCVIYAQHQNSPGSANLRYALAEFDMATLTTPAPLQLELKDETNDIPM